jgi:hypothetical protein
MRFALVAPLGLLVGLLSACGGGYPAGANPAVCTPGDDSTCDPGETCLAGGGTVGVCVCACDATWTCDSPCACDPECTSPEPECRADAECDGDACGVCDGGRCVSGCGAGRVCAGAATCLPAPCAGPSDCYPRGFCDAAGTCEDLSTLAGCAGASAHAPGPDPDGPLLFGAEQVDLSPDGPAWCARDPDHCPGGNVCGWRISWFDPQDDVGVTFAAIRLLFDGRETWAFAVTDVRPDSFVIEGCFEAGLEGVGGGALLFDAEHHRSNAICFAGQAP